jgi:hypothetical protein
MGPNTFDCLRVLRCQLQLVPHVWLYQIDLTDFRKISQPSGLKSLSQKHTLYAVVGLLRL